MDEKMKLGLMALFVGTLLVVSIVQAFELLGMKNTAESLSSTGVKTNSYAGSSGSGSNSAPQTNTLQNSLDSLGGMVGSC